MAEETVTQTQEAPPAVTAASVQEQANVTVDELLRDEIDGAVTEAIQKIEEGRKQPDPGKESKASAEPKEDLPPDKGQDGGEKAPEGETSGEDGKKKDEKKTDDAGKEPEVSDVLVERAIKAGMSISDARSFKKAEAESISVKSAP